MRRSESTKGFLSSHRTLQESVDFLPELPEGCSVDFLQRVLESFPIADNPYDKSDLREGLKIWDTAYLPFPNSVSMQPVRLSDMAPLRGTNTQWESIKGTLSLVGRPDGIHYVRPRGKFILDLMTDDLRLLQGAHILAHREPTAFDEDDYSFGQLSDVFLLHLVRLFVARTFGLTVNVHPEHEDRTTEDAFEKYGISVFGSSDLRDPVLVADPENRARIMPDKTVAVILGSVGIEAPPKHAAEGTSWKEINKWSCLPTLVTISGWECIDYLLHAPRVDLRGVPCCAIPCADLQEPDSFQELIEAASSAHGPLETSEDVWHVNDWLDSEDFRKGLSVTPQLPCPHCIRPSMRASAAVARPRTSKPRIPVKEISDTSSLELREWRSYVTFMRNCIEIGRKATAYHLGSVTSVRRRNSAFRKRSEKMHRIASLTEKFKRKYSQGYISEASAIQAEIEQLKEELK